MYMYIHVHGSYLFDWSLVTTLWYEREKKLNIHVHVNTCINKYTCLRDTHVQYLTLLSLHIITVLQMYYTVLHLSTMLSHTNVKEINIHVLLWLQYKMHVVP